MISYNFREYLWSKYHHSLILVLKRLNIYTEGLENPTCNNYKWCYYNKENKNGCLYMGLQLMKSVRNLTSTQGVYSVSRIWTFLTMPLLTFKSNVVWSLKYLWSFRMMNLCTRWLLKCLDTQEIKDILRTLLFDSSK